MCLGTTSAPPKFKSKKEVTGSGMLQEEQYSRIKRNLFITPEYMDDLDYYLNNQPGCLLGYDGTHSPSDIPSWMPMSFRPRSEMMLDSMCAYLTVYTFTPDDGNTADHEVLFKTKSDVYADRKALKSLIPMSPVDQEIINAVVDTQNFLIRTLGKTQSVWYLPTDFAQYALDNTHSAEYVCSIYKDKYMTINARHMSKIFIPINDEGMHWYLLVVDFIERKLVWLDSSPSEDRYHWRRQAILKLALFLEEMFLHGSLGRLFPFSGEDIVTAFNIVQEMRLPRQRPYSNDSGVWVCKWMIECTFSCSYDTVSVISATRMKLALYLLQSSNNVLLNEVLGKASTYWDDQVKKHNLLMKGLFSHY